MKMSIVINDRLMNEALGASGRATKQETIEEALRLLITYRHHTQIKTSAAISDWKASYGK
jgi:hypothetical protein